MPDRLLQLGPNSYNWIEERSYNQKLINKAAKNFRIESIKNLTKQEEKLLEKANKQVRQLLQQSKPKHSLCPAVIVLPDYFIA